MSDIDFKNFMKLYKDYTKQLYLFYVNDTTLSSDRPLIFRKNLLEKMSTSKKIKAVNNKIEQNKAQYNIDRPTNKICALSSANVSNSKFSTSKSVLPREDLLEKAGGINKHILIFAIS